MAEPFVGEIRMFTFDFPPTGWMQCDGQSLSVQQNPALFSLINFFYGGDGKQNFNLPDLRGRVVVNDGVSPSGTNYVLGKNGQGGQETVTLATPNLPAHIHGAYGASDPAGVVNPGPNGVLATCTDAGDPIYGVVTPGNMVPMNPGTVGTSGGSMAHNNMQPSLVLNFCIATTGYYPTRP